MNTLETLEFPPLDFNSKKITGTDREQAEVHRFKVQGRIQAFG